MDSAGEFISYNAIIVGQLESMKLESCACEKGSHRGKVGNFNPHFNIWYRPAVQPWSLGVSDNIRGEKL